MRMREVSVRIVHFVHELARAGDIDRDTLFDGFPSFSRPAAVGASWDDFAHVWERLEVACGGAEGLTRVARLAVPTAYEEFRVFASVFVSPLALLRFMMFRHLKTSFRTVEVTELEHSPDGRARWREHVRAPYRPCAAYHRGTRTLASLMPLHLDLPAADVTLTMIDDRTAEFDGYFPPSPKRRGRQAASSVLKLVAAQLEDAYAAIGDRALARPRAKLAEGAAYADWPERLDLSSRQRDVFMLLVEGRANKEIATILACSERNVEFHVGRILRAARVTSRSELLVKVLSGSGTEAGP
jgi:DNA-binding CsgD family transcriptional regulator